MPRLILASTSPRRRELLGLLELPFEVVGSDYDENLVSPAGQAPSAYVTLLAQGKAAEVAGRLGAGALVLGADTTVVLDGQFLNKPATAEDARRMLCRLSGRTHEVYTGLCLIQGQTLLIDHVRTDVTFDALSDDIVAAYVATGEPLDKAGAYGIQGQALSFIPAIRGDYFNVVGLPIECLRRLLLPYFPQMKPAPPQPLFPAAQYYGKLDEAFGARL